VYVITTPVLFSWPYWPVFAVVWIWAFWPEFKIVRAARKPAARSDSQDAGSYRVIVFGGGIAALLGFALAWTPILRVPVGTRPALFGVGLVMIILGSLLRRHCQRVLGSSFTGDVRADPHQRIVTTGAYALLRHPSYSAGILMNMGTGLALGSWASTALLALAAFAAYRYRIAVEERALLRVIGEPYRDFMTTRRRLIPFIY
jgi:protein-S-isoprenylcysteine O-methyltransferase Ste14